MRKVILFLSLFSFGLLSMNSSSKKDKKESKQLRKSFAYIPGTCGIEYEGGMVSLQSFMISQTEITNAAYALFLNDLLAQNEVEKHEIAKVNSSLWEEYGIKGYAEEYFTNEAFKNYPVVNITKEGAELYCEWLTEKYNSLVPDEEKLIFRLPLKVEWQRTAQGLSKLNPSYSWGSSFLTNSRGEFLANFQRFGDESISRDENGQLIIRSDVESQWYENGQPHFLEVTAPVNSYYPNSLGVYNLNGNVAELLGDANEVIGGSWMDSGYDIRNESVRAYTGASPTIGFRVAATVRQENFIKWKKEK